MEKIFSRKDPSKLLHIINRFEDINDRTNLVPDEQFLQVATMRLEEGKTFSPHKHIWKKSFNVADVVGYDPYKNHRHR